MYDYRTWTREQRAAALSERKQRGYPWHSPPHLAEAGRFRIITGTCYEHAKILATHERLAWFEDELLNHIKNQNLSCAAWVVLPNHYHLLVKIDHIKRFSRAQGQLHGRTSLEMNREDDEVGRKVWYRCQDRCMRSEAHYYTTLNYIHNNPVKHGYVDKWEDWPYSSFHWYLERKGRDWLLELWRDFPVLNYGDKWDV
jgi:putative transposase